MKPIHMLGPCECRWPVSADENGHLFCGEVCGSLEAYCEPHHARSLPDGTVEARPRIRFVEGWEGSVIRKLNAPVKAGLVPLRFAVAQAAQPVSATPRVRKRKPLYTRVIGAHGKAVDADGYETADRQPDLVEVFGGAR